MTISMGYSPRTFAMAPLDDFLAELNTRAPARHADWRTIDLHVHTPLSFDYHYKAADADARIADCVVEQRLDVVMFVDHERLPDPTFVDGVAKRAGCLALRGVELNVFGELL